MKSGRKIGGGGSSYTVTYMHWKTRINWGNERKMRKIEWGETKKNKEKRIKWKKEWKSAKVSRDYSLEKRHRRWLRPRWRVYAEVVENELHDANFLDFQRNVNCACLLLDKFFILFNHSNAFQIIEHIHLNIIYVYLIIRLIGIYFWLGD